jgi:hypothetical protein
VSVIALLLMAVVAFTAPTHPDTPSATERPSAIRTPAQRQVMQHLDGALRLLERRDLSALTPDQSERRALAVAALRAYRDAGRYPVNRDFVETRVPYFIDPVTDVHCAVGHLMASTGYGALARRIAAADNHVRVLDLRDDVELRQWLDSHGITLEEAARIQPTYDWEPAPFPPGDPTEHVIDETVLLSSLGVSGALSLAQHLTRVGHSSRALPAANLVVGFATIAMSVLASEDAGLRVATGAVGVVSAVSGIAGLQRPPVASRAASRRVQWRLAPSIGGRAIRASATWRF